MNPSPSRWTRVMFPAALVTFELVVYFSVDMYLPALRALQNQYGASDWSIQFTVTGWLVGAGTMQLVLGPLSDRYGRRCILLGGCLAFILATLGCALAPPLAWFVLLRVIQGSTICTALVAGYACVHEIFSTQEAVKTLAWMNSVTVLAPAIGPLLGAWVLSFGSWRTIFLMLAMAGLPALILVHRWMPETVPSGGNPTMSFASVFPAYRCLLANRAMMRHLAAFCLVFSIMLAWNVASPFLLIDPQSGNTGRFVRTQAYLYTLFIVGTRLANQWVGKKDVARMVTIGLGLCTAGAVLGFIASFSTALLPLPTVLFGLMTLGAGLLFPPLFRQTIELSKAPMGITMAVFSSGMNFFATIATLLVGALNVNSHLRYHLFAFVIAACALLTLRPFHIHPMGNQR